MKLTQKFQIQNAAMQVVTRTPIGNIAGFHELDSSGVFIVSDSRF